MMKIYKALKAHLNSLSPEELSKEYESITHEKFWNRWVEKVNSLSKERRVEILNKVIKKYSTQDYVDKEYSQGVEPRYELFGLYLRFAEKYGESYWPENIIDDFVGERWIVDDNYIVELLIGQGSIVQVYTIDEFNKKQDWLKKRKEEMFNK